MSLLERLRSWTRGSTPAASGTLAAEARSHVGHVRKVNEDRFLSRSDRGLWAVSDGMGGHSNGAAAASIAIGSLEDLAKGDQLITDEGVKEALQRANQMICSVAQPGSVCGATIVAARREGDRMILYWAGDSRAYRVSGGHAQLVTTDHSIVQELVDAGAISAAEAEKHPQSHVITRALGVSRTIEIDSVTVPFAPDDLLLLCSDGVSRTLSDAELVRPCASLAQSADRLLEGSLLRDGTDNATLVLIGPAGAAGARA